MSHLNLNSIRKKVYTTAKKYPDLLRFIPLVIILILALTSFFYGWYLDDSTPQSGVSWADQSLYHEVTNYFSKGELPPNPGHLHYAVGYSLLGVVGGFFIQSDPFMIVSLALYIASLMLCYFGAKKLFGVAWSVVFCILLFLWDGTASTFNFASELFAIPWNNQVLFFAFAFFFWLFTSRLKETPSYKMILLVGLVAGLSFVTREESILFMAAFVAIYLFVTKVKWRKWLLCYGIIMLCFLPQVIIKQQVVNSVLSTARGPGYSQLLTESYFQPEYFYRNTWETIIHPHHFGDDVNREALLEAAPWLWLSPLGIGWILFTKKGTNGEKLFAIVSLALIGFYLSGNNMAAHKLAFHCLRYISPGFIVLNLGVIVVMRETVLHARRKMQFKVKF